MLYVSYDNDGDDGDGSLMHDSAIEEEDSQLRQWLCSLACGQSYDLFSWMFDLGGCSSQWELSFLE